MKNTRNGRSAGLYVRISQDRTGAGLGVDRQEADCRALAERQGWDVVDIYRDNDLSAYRGSPRPEYRRLLDDVREGRVDAIVAWHPDRLHRSPLELEGFISLVEARDVAIRTVQAGDLDLGTPSGRAVARTLGAWARFESEHKAERQARAAEERAKAGKWNGGGTRPFGLRPLTREDGTLLRPVTFEIDQAEARLIRDAARRVLAGESLRSICVEWNKLGVRPPRGERWQRVSLRQVLMSARLAGWREHNGKFLAAGAWPPILSRPMVERLRAVLADPGRSTSRPTGRTRLLTGLLVCQSCGRHLRGSRRSDGVGRYSCHPDPGCGRTHILSEPLDALVIEAALRVIDSPALALAVQQRSDRDLDRSSLDRLRADEAALETLESDYYEHRRVDRGRYLELRTRLEERIQRANETLVAATSATALRVSAGTARARWAGMSFDRRRALLAAVIRSITVGPGRRGVNRFDESRIDIEWADEAKEAA